MSLSCIIPLETHNEWTVEKTEKVLSLKTVFDEVILVGSDQSFQLRLPPNFKRISTTDAKLAHLLNKGAQEATSTYLSFLLFDSDFEILNFQKLRLGLKEKVLFYFDLQFSNPAPALCGVNAWAANARADIARTPFFEQCLTLSKKDFYAVGAFNEILSEGADAEFIKRWRKAGNQIQKAKGCIYTSPRKYIQNGWLKSTQRSIAWNLKFWAGKEPKELLS